MSQPGIQLQVILVNKKTFTEAEKFADLCRYVAALVDSTRDNTEFKQELKRAREAKEDPTKIKTILERNAANYAAVCSATMEVALRELGHTELADQRKNSPFYNPLVKPVPLPIDWKQKIKYTTDA